MDYHSDTIYYKFKFSLFGQDGQKRYTRANYRGVCVGGGTERDAVAALVLFSTACLQRMGAAVTGATQQTADKAGCRPRGLRARGGAPRSATFSVWWVDWAADQSSVAGESGLDGCAKAVSLAEPGCIA